MLSPKIISHHERINWIRLARSENISRRAFFNLLKIHGNVDSALDHAASYSVRGGLRVKVCSYDKAEREFGLCQKIGAEIILFNDENYPRLLKEIADPPPIITIHGQKSLLNNDIIAVVGSRNPSISGCKFAAEITRELGSKGIVVVSGLARGIDAVAHKNSIDTGAIAVIAGGIDHIYPKENARLYQQITSQGLLISENAFGCHPSQSSFPQRNRLISGLALGVVVVEATLKSGTLITARLALEQNREVFAMPGSPFDPRHQGTNLLIKQGAKLIENVDDIIEEITPIIGHNQLGPDKKLEATATISDDEISQVTKLILDKISYDPISADEIVAVLQIPVKIVNIAITQLQLMDLIQYQNGKLALK